MYFKGILLLPTKVFPLLSVFFISHFQQSYFKGISLLLFDSEQDAAPENRACRYHWILPKFSTAAGQYQDCPPQDWHEWDSSSENTVCITETHLFITLLHCVIAYFIMYLLYCVIACVKGIFTLCLGKTQTHTVSHRLVDCVQWDAKLPKFFIQSIHNCVDLMSNFRICIFLSSSSNC